MKPSKKLMELLELMENIGQTDKSLIKLLTEELGSNEGWMEELMNKVKQNPKMSTIEIGMLALDIAGWDDVEMEE